MAFTSGAKLGPYVIESPLGAGGMGEVYRARDSRLEREVAIKILPADVNRDTSLRQRLEREAKAISRLSHRPIRAAHRPMGGYAHSGHRGSRKAVFVTGWPVDSVFCRKHGQKGGHRRGPGR